jgi:hypothetical protein
VILAVVGSVWLLAANFWPFLLPKHASEYPFAEMSTQKADFFADLYHDTHRNQVVIRTPHTNNAGIGSVVAQLRSSAAIATMLGATLATYSVQSEHGYRVASLLGLDLLETRLDAKPRVCSLSASPSYARIPELVESWCGNPRFAQGHAPALRGMFSECDIILDDRPWDVRYDMAKCTWRWVKQVFSKLGVRKRARGIGLHIRWGDMANPAWPFDQRTPVRSTPIEKAAQLLRKIRECGVRDALTVYMETHNTTMLSGLNEPYRIVDTGNDLDDLLDLASNRLLILDVSSYTVLAHQIADGGLTIVPDTSQFDITWEDNGENHVLRWQEVLSIKCSDFSVLFSP